MSTIVLTSIGTSPGLTSTATAMTLAWPRPALLIETDTSKPSTIISGYMRGSISSSHGLTALTQIHGVHGLDQTAVWEAALPLVADLDTVPEGHDKFVLPAHASPDAADASGAFWDALATQTTQLSEGLDIIIDLGRWNGARDYRNALLANADWALFGARTTLQSTAALRGRIESAIDLRTRHGHLGHHSVLGFATSVGGYPLAEIAKFLGLPASGTIPFDPRWGSVYSDGYVPPKGLKKGTYQGAIRSLVSTTQKHLESTRELLDPSEEVTGE